MLKVVAVGHLEHVGADTGSSVPNAALVNSRTFGSSSGGAPLIAQTVLIGTMAPTSVTNSTSLPGVMRSTIASIVARIRSSMPRSLKSSR